MAHKKGAGSTKNGRDSNSKRLGLKKIGGEIVTAGNILIRQQSFQIKPGQNVGAGKYNTLFALQNGTVNFKKQLTKNNKKIQFVEVF